jgi:hypothetical protein
MSSISSGGRLSIEATAAAGVTVMAMVLCGADKID